MKSNYFIFSLVFFLFCCTACEDDSLIVCDLSQGFVVEDGNCICPDDNIRAYGNCINLVEGRYYGITEGCACSDTLVWEIIDTAEDSDAKTIRINQDLAFSGEFINEAFRVRKELSGLTIETTEGDSLFIVTDNVLMTCQALPDEALPQQVLFEGLFSSNKDTLASTLTYVNNSVTPSEIISTCEVNFIRQ